MSHNLCEMVKLFGKGETVVEVLSSRSGGGAMWREGRAVVVMTRCALASEVCLLLHKAKTASEKWRDGADEVSESKSEAVKGKMQRIPPLSRARVASDSELWSSLCKQ